MGASDTGQSPTPRELFERYHEVVRRYDVEAVVSAFARDGRWEFPFGAHGVPAALKGRAEIREFIAPLYRRAIDAGRRILRYAHYAVYETNDPEVIIAEFAVETAEAATGAPSARSFVQIARIRGGEIQLLRDYFNPASLAGGGLSPAGPEARR